MPDSHERPPKDKRRSFGSVLFLFDPILRAGVALLTLPFRGLVLWYRELRFARRLREQGRFIPWPQLEPRLIRGEGTLIVEQARHERVRLWWTPGDVLRVPPGRPGFQGFVGADRGPGRAQPRDQDNGGCESLPGCSSVRRARRHHSPHLWRG